MQHQDSRPGPNHHLDGSPLPSYPLSQRQQQPELLQQQQQHYHQHPQGTAYSSLSSLPPAANHFPPQHNSHSLPSTLLQQQQAQTQHHPHPQHTSIMSSPSHLTQSSHMAAAYAPYPPPSAQPTRESPRFGIYTCPEPNCQKQFTDMESYRIHAQSDHRSSTNTHQMKDANQQIPENDKPFVCEHPGCGRAFKQFGNLKTHVRKHTGERPYQCNFEGCGKNFAQLGNLKTHEKIHWPVKPYICDYPDCRRGFTQRGNLKAHLIKVHHVTSS